MTEKKTAKKEQPVNAGILPVSPGPSDLPPAEESLSLENKVIALGSGIVWRSSTGKIELNSFTGKISTRVPADLTDKEKAELTVAINTGRIRITETVETGTPFNYENADPDKIAKLYIILDEKRDDVFETMVERISSAAMLTDLISLEINSRNRDQRLKAMREKLSRISR